MEITNMISEIEFCTNHNIEVSFIRSIHEIGLIELIVIDETMYFHSGQLNNLEKILRMYFDLNINLEGIDTVFQLLQKMESMQEELTILKNKIEFYEIR